MIADSDPEDRFDASDPLPERLAVLAAVAAALLDAGAHHRAARLVDLARLLRNAALEAERLAE